MLLWALGALALLYPHCGYPAILSVCRAGSQPSQSSEHSTSVRAAAAVPCALICVPSFCALLLRPPLCALLCALSSRPSFAPSSVRALLSEPPPFAPSSLHPAPLSATSSSSLSPRGTWRHHVAGASRQQAPSSGRLTVRLNPGAARVWGSGMPPLCCVAPCAWAARRAAPPASLLPCTAPAVMPAAPGRACAGPRPWSCAP
mmetsp:Transcript_28298/g.62138  ORF Transcript_28298/g.62138 Transcript_28298/m.62138 type:complete len:202 (-) Transcript_28298:382-987(-)